MRVIGIHTASEGSARATSVAAISQYAASRGLVKPANWYIDFTDGARAAQPGDCVIAMTMRQIGERPRIMLNRITDAVSRGVAVHVCELGCDLLTVLPLLRTICATYGDIEDALTLSNAALSKAEKHAMTLELHMASRFLSSVRFAFDNVDVLSIAMGAGKETRAMHGKTWRDQPTNHPDLTDEKEQSHGR